mmetsp:Transcript_74941/g.219544  ORF Transcript_74941/g.219544 Transcript_74941/m.219544 type:complete len:269 (+) Transcript_74941:1146-1952(+)
MYHLRYHIEDKLEPDELEDQQDNAKNQGCHPPRSNTIRGDARSLEAYRPQDVEKHEDARDKKDDHKHLEESVGEHAPDTSPLLGIRQVLASLCKMQRHVSHIHDQHDDCAHAAPTAHVGDDYESQRGHVVHQHLAEVGSLRLEKQGHGHLRVARGVHEIVAAQVAAHGLDAAAPEPRPPPLARPRPLERRYEQQAYDSEHAVEHCLHGRLRALLNVAGPHARESPENWLDEEEPRAPVQREEAEREGAADCHVALGGWHSRRKGGDCA